MTLTYPLRLAVYDALEERSYLTIQDLALRLDSGAPATQAQVRAVLYAWLEHILAANPQTEADLIPQWQIATPGAGSKIKTPLEEMLRDNFWPDEATGAWTAPTLAQREILRRRRAKPQQLSLGLEVEGEQMALGLRSELPNRR